MDQTRYLFSVSLLEYTIPHSCYSERHTTPTIVVLADSCYCRLFGDWVALSRQWQSTTA